MDAYAETFNTWNKIAKLYEEKFMELDLYNDTYDAFCDMLGKNNPKVLEIGCGPGNISKYLLSKRPDLILEGIDVAPNMIELAKKNNPKAIFKVMDCRQLDKLETIYDGIICGFCIPYLSMVDCSELIKDCSRRLSDGGILYISFVEGDHNNSGFITGSSNDRTYFYYHELNELRSELVKNSFNVSYLAQKNYNKSDGTSEIHTILIAAR